VNAYATLDIPDSLVNKLEKDRVTLPNLMQKINSVYDDRSGTVISQSNSYKDFGFQFGIYTGFWRMRKKDGSFYFTPEEIAAITLHEIGHFDYWIKVMSQPITRMLDASDLIDYVKDKPEPKTILLILDRLRASKYLDRSWRDMLKVTRDYFGSKPDITNPEYTQALTAMEALIVAEVGNKSVSDINVMTIWGEYDHTNLPNTRLYEVDSERSADEFAARNGAYAPLISALKKMADFEDTESSVYVKQFMWVFPGVIFSFLMKFSSLFKISGEDISFGYDPIVRRLELIAQTAKHAFSNTDLPQHVKEDIFSQIKEIEMYIKEREMSPYRIVRKNIKVWKDEFSKFGRIIISPLHSRLGGDYRRLQDANRNLGRHSLYYLSDK
jgi:hypothetical protein